MLFCLLSLFFLSVVESLEDGVSALDLKQFVARLKADSTLLVWFTIVFISVFKGMKTSPYIFLSFCLYVLTRSLGVFFIDLDKLILMLTFLYSVISYNFFLFLRLELNEPFYNPSYPDNIMPDFGYRKLPILVKQGNANIPGFLTNWGENGFYCKLPESDSIIKGKIEVEITLENHTFFTEGVIMTNGRGGIGVRILKNPVPDLGWSDYYGIINELGLRPAYK